MDEITPEMKNVLVQWGDKVGIKVMELLERTLHIPVLGFASNDNPPQSRHLAKPI